jgi:hypothetical protein
LIKPKSIETTEDESALTGNLLKERKLQANNPQLSEPQKIQRKSQNLKSSKS